MNSLGFLGCGHMGRAILSGLLESEMVDPSEVYVSARSSAHATAKQYGVNPSTPHEILDQCQTIILAIKPQQLMVVRTWVDAWRRSAQSSSAQDKTAPIKPSTRIEGGPLVISLLAGVSLAQLREVIPNDFQLVRAMPNLPAQVSFGVTLCCGEPQDPFLAESLERGELLFAPLGHVERLADESMMHAATAISGCGPAYMFNVIEALADAGVYEGLKRDVALRLAAYTVWGSGALAVTEHPAILKDRVTSPGGVTIAGVRSLENAGIRGAFIEAVIAASARSREMGEE